MQKLDETGMKRKSIALRRDILTMLSRAGSGHTGGSLSIVEILVELYYRRMNIDPREPSKRDRDRFVLSKGHACPALYAVLADLGFFPREELWTLRKLGSRLQGHPQYGLPGLEISSGSLGQGLSVAVGLALADRMDSLDNKVYCLMGDGETNEGQIWEAAMTASHYSLSRLYGIVDFNKLQIDGFTCDVQHPGEFRHKWEKFGWHTVEVDGHDFQQLSKGFDELDGASDRPKLMIAHTVKGKGVSFIENKAGWHGIAPKEKELASALEELKEQEEALI
ncbi:MAG: transketolase [Candidatus Omnitrophica bacterium]|nr:transketolase [Candidatus Omnitrophota bacterium]